MFTISGRSFGLDFQKPPLLDVVLVARHLLEMSARAFTEHLAWDKTGPCRPFMDAWYVCVPR